MLTTTRYTNPYLLIDGTQIEAADRKTSPVVNPSTGEAIGTLPHATTADLDRALAAAGRAFAAWRDLTAFERSNILRAGAALIRERSEEIATQQTLEQGKLYRDGLLEVRGSADIIEWYAEEGRRAYGRVIPARTKGGHSYVVRQPIGPGRGILTVELPGDDSGAQDGRGTRCRLHADHQAGRRNADHDAPARASADRRRPAAGRAASRVRRAERHLDVSDRLAVIRKVSFTGSTIVGKEIGKLAAAGMKRTTMELGGHAPVIVFGDADLEKAVAQCALSKMRNGGQVCIAPTRFFAHESVYETFVQKLGDIVRGLKVGDGFDPAAQVGPLANPRRVDAMERLVKDAVAKGARLIAGGKRIPGGGFFFEPTVLADVPPNADIMNEEPFGPIAVLASFKTLEGVIAESNRLPYGLAAYAFTESLANANAVFRSA